MTSFDYETLLSLEEKITVIWNIDGYELGYLNKKGNNIKNNLDISTDEEDGKETKNDKDIKEGTKIEVPMWLAFELAKRNFVKIEVPKYLGERFLKKLEIGAEEANIHEHSPYFYRNGFELADLLQDDNLKPLMFKVFTRRFQKIFSNAQNFQRSNFSLFTQNLSENEKILYDIIRKSNESFEEWKGSVGEFKEAKEEFFEKSKKQAI